MNTRIGHIACRQARMASLAFSPSLSPEISPNDKGDDDEDDADSSDDDEITSS